MKNIQIRFKFPSNNELRKEMQSAMKAMEKYSQFDLKLDTKSFNKSLKEMSKVLDELKSKVSKFGVLDEIINEGKTKQATKSIQDQTEALKKQQAVIKDAQTIKTSKTELLNSDGTKSLVKELESVKTKTGEIVQMTKNYDATSGKLTSTVMNTTNEIEKQEQAQQKALDSLNKFKSQMQTKLNTASDNSLISPTVISNLQTQLNNLNVNNFKDNMEGLKQSITSLASSDSGIVRLQNAINSIQNSMTNTKNKYGSLVNDKDIQSTTEKVNILKYSMQDLMNGKSMSGSAITKAINNANNSLKTMNTNAKSASTALNITQKDAMSLGSAIQTTMGKFGIYASTAVAMRQLFNVIKDGIGYVKSLDEAFFNISSTMDITKTQFKDVATQVQQMAKDMGIGAESVMQVVQTYSNASTSMDEVLSKTQGSVILSNITGMDTGEVTKATNSALNAFKMLEEEGATATDSVNRFGDSLVKISQNMNYDFGEGITEIISGIKESGNVAYESGMSYESFASKLGAMIEATGRSGSELSAGMKMIVARTHQIKELGDELGIAEDEFGKAGKALAEFGIAVEDSEGVLRNMDDILEDVNSIWGTLTRTEQSYLAEMMAGNRQRLI